jgi:hypothetical protein
MDLNYRPIPAQHPLPKLSFDTFPLVSK